jgi:hypothetical protein
MALLISTYTISPTLGLAIEKLKDGVTISDLFAFAHD